MWNKLHVATGFVLLLAIMGPVPAAGQPQSPEQGVVYLRLPDGGCGAGIVVAVREKDVLILTAYHNLERSPEEVVSQLPVQFSRADPTIVPADRHDQWTDSSLDLALLVVVRQQVPPAVTPVRFGSLDDVQQGSNIFAVGHQPTRGQWLLDSGHIIQPIGTDITFAGRLVDRGFSGGPVLAQDGSVIGMTIEATEDHVGYARSVDTIRLFLRGAGLAAILGPQAATGGRPRPAQPQPGEGGSDAFEQGFAAYRSGDFPQALRAFQQATAAGNVWAMVFLGRMYDDGKIGIRKDPQQARDWYEKAADAGNVTAMGNLATLYKDEFDDYGRAFQWWEKAASTGDPEAMNMVGRFYEEGWGGSRLNSPNYKKAREWFEKAAAAGNSSAMNNLGMLYYEGHRGATPQDFQQSADWLKKAADKGNATAMLNLGSIYEDLKEYQQAREWYEKAAAAGDKDAPKRLDKLVRKSS